MLLNCPITLRCMGSCCPELSKPGAYCPLSSKDELGETRFLIRSVLSGTMFKFFPCTLLLYNYVLVGLNKLLRWSR